MRKFDCYKPDYSNFDVAYYCYQPGGYWLGFDKYGKMVRDRNTGQYITDANILNWMRTQGGTIVDKPVYETKFEPKLFLNIWQDKVWYILFTKEDCRYTYYLSGQRRETQPYHRKYSDYIQYSKMLKPFLGDSWIWQEVTENKDNLIKMVMKKGTYNYV